MDLIFLLMGLILLFSVISIIWYDPNAHRNQPKPKEPRIRQKADFKTLQDLRRGWIAQGHKNVPNPGCCCWYEKWGENWYTDSRTGEKIYCPLHKEKQQAI